MKLLKTNKSAKARGRPSKLNNEIIKIIADAIKAGCYLETAGALAGVCRDTIHQWIRQGENESDGIHRRFADEIKKSNAEFELRAIRQIDLAAQDGVWQASAWKLERRFPDRWGNRARLEVEPVLPKNEPKLDLSILSDDELALAEKLGVAMSLKQ